MKKLICLILAVSMAFALAACGSNGGENANGGETTTLAPAALTGTLEEITNQIYANATAIEMAMGPATAIDLADVDAANYYLGVASTDSIENAVFSEPMIGSIPYSLCLVKAKEGADIEALKNEILNGVNARKWLCVAAEKIAVVNCGNIIMMVMAEEAIVDDVCKAFATVSNNTASEPLTKVGEVQEEIPADDGIGGMDMPADMPAYDGEEIPAEDGIVLA